MSLPPFTWLQSQTTTKSFSVGHWGKNEWLLARFRSYSFGFDQIYSSSTRTNNYGLIWYDTNSHSPKYCARENIQSQASNGLYEDWHSFLFIFNQSISAVMFSLYCYASLWCVWEWAIHVVWTTDCNAYRLMICESWKFTVKIVSIFGVKYASNGIRTLTCIHSINIVT